MNKFLGKIRSKMVVYAVIFGVLTLSAPISLADNTPVSDPESFQTSVQSAQNDSSSQTGTQPQPQVGTGTGTVSITQTQIQPQSPTTLTPAQEQEAFLNRLNEELKISKTEYYSITSNIHETRNRIDALKDDVTELQKQLQYFDYMIDDVMDKLFTVVRQVVRTENEIRIIYEEIDIKQTALEYQKQLLKDYIQKLYVYSDTYLDVDKNGDIDAFKLLLSDNDTGDVLKEIKYLGILEETGTRMVERLDELNKDLIGNRVQLETKKTYLEGLQKELAVQKQNLDSEKASKENMLVLTRNQDQIYRSLLAQSIKQQQDSLADVQAYQASLEFVKKKIQEEGANFDISKYQSYVGQKFMTLYEFQNMPASAQGFIWPVMPERGISAYFHDAAYRAYFGVQHNAIDIRTAQGTPVMAASDGVVYKAKDNDYGYSYIMLVHHDGFMTTYGHISQIMVTEGQVVKAGSVIGLSGGMPGTKGAGYMTTGPHLHFEVMKNGAYVDPMRFLPLAVIPKEIGVELPTEYKADWEKALLEGVSVNASVLPN